MSDTPALTWELRPRHLVICPGLSFEEWGEIWASVQGSHESSSFWVGDALVYGEIVFGESLSAALTADGIGRNERTKQCKWVCSRIEPARRRASLSFSVHRAVAKLEATEQDELLCRAETEGWDTKAMLRAVKDRDEAHGITKGSRRNAQTAAEQVDPDSEVTRVTNGAAHPEPPPLSSEPLEDPAEELRSLIDGIRWIAGDLVLGKANLLSVQDLERRALMALGRPAYSCSPLRSDMPAERLVPPDWSIRIDGSESSTNTRKWSVELRKGNQRAIGAGPSLTCAVTEACLAARLSDLEAGR